MQPRSYVATTLKLRNRHSQVSNVFSLNIIMSMPTIPSENSFLLLFRRSIGYSTHSYHRYLWSILSHKSLWTQLCLLILSHTNMTVIIFFGQSYPPSWASLSSFAMWGPSSWIRGSDPAINLCQETTVRYLCIFVGGERIFVSRVCWVVYVCRIWKRYYIYRLINSSR